MTVQLRAKRSQGRAERRRPRGDDVAPGRGRRTDAGPPAVGMKARAAVEDRARSAAGPEAIPPPPQDRALYACSCGFVFSHDVSTSVACPHCGSTQAW
jgi:hypothetical protein